MNTDSPEYDYVPPRTSSTAKRKLWLIIACVVCVTFVFFYFLGPVLDALTAARASESRNHMKQIGLALHNYLDDEHVMPAAWIEDENGQGSLSWMYSILPIMDAEPVFQKIDSNYPWNDPRNVPFTQAQIEGYINPQISEKVSDDGFAYSHYAASSHLFKPNEFLRFRQITDNYHTTLMVGEINDGFQPWAKPGHTRDPVLGFNKGPDSFGSPFEGGVHFMFADGRVVFLSNDIDPKVLKALATPAGGEQIDKDQILEALSPPD